jgi:hypothetical protein
MQCVMFYNFSVFQFIVQKDNFEDNVRLGGKYVIIKIESNYILFEQPLLANFNPVTFFKFYVTSVTKHWTNMLI